MADKTFKIGDDVLYIDSKGLKKLGKIIGTAATITPGTDVPVPDTNEAHIMIFSPAGKVYTRQNVTYNFGPDKVPNTFVML